MDKNNVLELYSSESREWQIKFLSRLAHQITIFARDTYEFDSDSLSNPVQLRCINEIMHRIIGQQFKLIMNDNGRYPDDVFIKMMFDMADCCNFEDHMSSGIKDSIEICMNE